MLTVGVDYGYEPIEGTDGIRYIILIEPEMLDALRNGTPVGSMIVPEVRGRIQAFQIVTSGKLSKEIPPPTSPPAEPTSLKLPGPAESAIPNETAAPPKFDWPPLTDLGPSEPRLLPPDTGKVVQASGEDRLQLDGPSGTVNTLDPEVLKTAESEPWYLLPLASLVAVGSSIGMFFFGWLTFDYRSRYLELLRDSVDTGRSWLDEPLNGADADPLGSESITFPANSKQAAEEEAETSTPEEPVWQDQETDTEDSLDDWLNEANDRGRKSRRNRKRSR